jgi:D,D-heptose 1,7-bisphosphate phosphatase
MTRSQIAIVRQAVILVGGQGSRLGAVGAATPKPLLEIASGVRFLDVVVEDAARHGFTNILLLAGHRSEQVIAAYEGRTVHGAKVSVVAEPSPLGTGGALRHAAERLDAWFVAANGDSVFDINWRALAQAPDPKIAARLALRREADPSRYGVVALEGKTITAFREKDAAHSGPALVNSGLYLIQRDAVLAHINGATSLEQAVFPELARRGALQGEIFDGFFIDIGLPNTYEDARRIMPARRIRPAAFLDRDGVLNVDVGYAHRPDQLQWIAGAQAAVRTLNDAGYLVIVVTNQSGVARGLYPESQIGVFHEAMEDALAEIGAHIDAFYACPFHAEGTVAAYIVTDHPDRKPNPGMLIRAMREWAIDVGRSFMIGDQDSDIVAARRAGVRGYRFDPSQSLQAVVAAALADGAKP